jgi:phosphoribosylglycinamide formyltransferase-1
MNGTIRNIAIFASGAGSNAKAIIEYFKGHPTIKVALVITNNPSAGVIQIAHENKIISAILSKEALANEQAVMPLMKAQDIHFIALAGYLQMVPTFLLAKFPNKIVNIHPALLPKHGGKGMYGIKVHQAVLAAGDAETGITIHYVNEHYDEGKIISQKTLAVNQNETAETLAARVLGLEHEWYPKTIEVLLAGVGVKG